VEKFLATRTAGSILVYRFLLALPVQTCSLHIGRYVKKVKVRNFDVICDKCNIESFYVISSSED